MVKASQATVAVGIATYRRPELLAELLDSLHSVSVPGQMTVYVVDNDPLASGREVSNDYRHVVHRYVVEENAGIAEARNRFLDELGDETHLVFVDDDERVDRNWLIELTSTMDRFDSDVVAGPVVPIFPDDAPRWAVEGGFFERPRHDTGTRLVLAATNNVLVKRSTLEELESPRFDISFSETGGSDSELFNRMVKTGAVIVWCDEAIVSELVPHWRMTREWVSKRAERTGNVRARLLMQDRRYFRVAIEGVGRMLFGAFKVARCRVQRRDVNADALNTWMRGRGLLKALTGNVVREYARSNK